uniref:Uncharacterized protein n=1 Tax=Lactuca sativa TaxID=4236 RepID=A0A9R1XIU7_LACSA|nr:hypothetical protein LSAT_V11C400211320 [Lactuca sativa]
MEVIKKGVEVENKKAGDGGKKIKNEDNTHPSFSLGISQDLDKNSKNLWKVYMETWRFLQKFLTLGLIYLITKNWEEMSEIHHI